MYPLLRLRHVRNTYELAPARRSLMMIWMSYKESQRILDWRGSFLACWRLLLRSRIELWWSFVLISKCLIALSTLQRHPDSFLETCLEPVSLRPPYYYLCKEKQVFWVFVNRLDLTEACQAVSLRLYPAHPCFRKIRQACASIWLILGDENASFGGRTEPTRMI